LSRGGGEIKTPVLSIVAGMICPFSPSGERASIPVHIRSIGRIGSEELKLDDGNFAFPTKLQDIFMTDEIEKAIQWC
jgi:hypothetical protein